MSFASAPLRAIRFVWLAVNARLSRNRSDKLQFLERAVFAFARVLGLSLSSEERRLVALLPDLAARVADDHGRNIVRSLDFLDKERAASQILCNLPFMDGRPFYYDPMRIDQSQVAFLIDRIGLHDCYAINSIESESPVIVDGGAHIGVFSRFVTYVYPDAKLYAVEPDRDNFQLLQINLSEANNAVAVNQAFLDGRGEVTLKRSDAVDWRSTLAVNETFFDEFSEHGGEYSGDYKVPTLSVDDFIADQGLDRLDLLKLVIPGMIELQVLAGARSSIEQLRPRVAVTVYSGNADAVDQFFDQLGYRSMTSPWQPPEGGWSRSSICLFAPD